MKLKQLGLIVHVQLEPNMARYKHNCYTGVALKLIYWMFEFRKILSAFFVSSIALLVFGGFSNYVFASPPGFITEYNIPTSNSKPYQIVEGPDNNLWFTESNTKKIGKMDKAGNFTEYPTSGTLSANPNYITVGPDNNLWFTLTSAHKIGKITTGGMVTEYSLAASSQPLGIVTGPDGRLWIAGIGTNKIYRIDYDGTIYDDYSLTATPYFITADYDKKVVWFMERSSSGDYMGYLDMSGNLTEHAYPSGHGTLYGVTMGPDGNAWFANSNDEVGFVTSAGAYTFFTMPTSGNGFWFLEVGHDNHVWATARTAGKIVRISADGSSINSYTTPNTGHKPHGITKGTDGDMWYVEYDGNQVARIGTGVTPSSPQPQDGYLGEDVTGIYWHDLPVIYRLNNSLASNWKSAIRASAQEWSGKTDISFVEGSITTSSDPTTTDHIVWEGAVPESWITGCPPKTTLACTRTTWDTSTNQVLDADTVFNENIDYSTSSLACNLFNSFFTFDVFTVSLHELGHWGRLSHTSDRNRVMFHQYNGCDEELHIFDIASMNQNYPGGN